VDLNSANPLAGLKIRNATTADGPRVLELVAAVLSEFGLEIEPDGIDSDLKNIENSYIGNGGAFLILEKEDGQLAGSLGLFREDESTCQLRKMYLLSELRGRGIGKYLLQYSIELARKLGFKRMTLETSSRLQAANRLYSSFGFQPIEFEESSRRADQAYAIEL
jgi:GNAT superfamily N-acetyltransferase